MKFLEDAYSGRYKDLIISKRLNITKAREVFLEAPPILLPYYHLAGLSDARTGEIEKDEAFSEKLSLSPKLDQKKMNACRQQVKRFNDFWRKMAKGWDDKGSWLVPESVSTSSTRREAGAWKLQVLLLLPPEERK